MKKLFSYIGSVIALPFVLAAERVQKFVNNENAKRNDNRIKSIRGSYNVKMSNGELWITHDGTCVIPVNDAWTVDELKFELNRIITNSINSIPND